VQFNSAQREITIKVVYYGPPLSGKTTNLQSIHKLMDPQNCGRLTVLDTADDRTLFFDLLPLMVTTESGYRIKLKLFTVPGQVIHAATRRIVLAGADGVVFVADSRRAHARANNEFWHGMRRYLKANSLDPDTIPIVIQFNKRDLPDVRTEEELDAIRQRGREPVFGAVAISGDGVLETLYGLLVLIFRDLNQRYDFERRFEFSAKDLLRGIFADSLKQAKEAAAQPGSET
jgi:signal recognition particle receptor subunit beta